MITISLEHGHHDWQKQNLVTVFKNKTHYDILECSGCKMIGKTGALGYISLKCSYSKEKIDKCPAYKEPSLESLQKFKYIVTNSPWPNRLKNGSEVILVEPRKGYNGKWYKKADGTLLFLDEDDGKFKLIDGEVEQTLTPTPNE